MARLTVGEVIWKINGDSSGFNKSIQQSQEKAKGFGSFLTKLKIGAVAVGAGLMTMAKSALGNAAALEQNQIALTTMLKSADKAKAVLKEFRDFGASTPFETTEIIKSGKQLIAFGVSADNVTATLKRIGDVAAGIGAPLGSLAEIYGKIKVSQTVYNEDLNQLAGRGIPIFEELAKVMGVNASEIKKMSSEGKIGFKEIEQAFKNMSGEGGKFNGLMEAQSKSLSGLWSTLNSQITELSTTMGQEMAPAAKDMVKVFSNIVTSGGIVTTTLTLIAKSLATIILTVAKAVSGWSALSDTFSKKMAENRAKELAKNIEVLGRNMGVVVKVDGKLTKLESKAIISAARRTGNIKQLSATYKKYNNALQGVTSADTDLVKSTELLNSLNRENSSTANKAAESNKKLAKILKDMNKPVKNPVKKPGVKKTGKSDAEKEIERQVKLYGELNGILKTIAMAFDGVSAHSKQTASVLGQIGSVVGEVGSKIGDIFSGIVALQTGIIESRIAGLDAQMQKELEAAGVAEETTQQTLEKEIAAAKKAGDKETVITKKKELERSKIQEKYAEKRKMMEYEIALMQWKFQLATAIATAPLTILNAITAGWHFGPIGAGIYGALAAAAAGVQIAAVAGAKPQAPSFQSGGIVQGNQPSGDNVSAQVNSGELILNGAQQRRLFDMADGKSDSNMIRANVSADVTWSEIYQASKNGDLFIDSRSITNK